MTSEKNNPEKSPLTLEENEKSPIRTAAEEGFTPEEEKELLEKCEKLIEEFDEEMEKGDNTTDLPTASYRLYPE
ncbi:hypothetical protein [Argonema antarcticum]|uniref:hypothetical protein n=1 Tax=Argonema antarcticum TaxID=2942763 RepID=UPI002011715C|nr:hypothetical protein [Argonema antarcticum]MCL1470082.1 hypothetical protein [Argonema antarcticum A004/B2]